MVLGSGGSLKVIIVCKSVPLEKIFSNNRIQSMLAKSRFVVIFTNQMNKEEFRNGTGCRYITENNK